MDTRVAIVGSGFSGLATAIRLKQAGIEDFVVLERGDDLGGTWRDNTYPGCACDVPSHLYSFSFAPNPEWSRTFSGQVEIWDYLHECAERFGVMPHIRFGHELLEAEWDEPAQRWRLDTAGGEVSAQIAVMATGALTEPSIPAVPGIDQFEGTVFHSATWDHEHDLAGERVAVIGTGASSIQFVPEIQGRVGHLTVFQRTAPWIMPRPDRDVTEVERRVYRALPAAQLAMRAAIYWGREALVPMLMGNATMRALAERRAKAHIGKYVKDPALREAVTPDYAIGCKRILISDDYYATLTRPNVELVPHGVSAISGNSVIAVDGSEHEVDTIIFGTGFHVTDWPSASRVRGRSGDTLADVWHGSPSAYRGATVAGFPNLFMVLGPNTGLGHNSIVFMIESLVNYVIDALRTMDEHGAGAIEVRPDAQAAFNDAVDRKMTGSVWTEGGCASWYLDAKGRNAILWPGFTWPFRRLTRRFDPAAYELRAAAPGREPVVA